MFELLDIIDLVKKILSKFKYFLLALSAMYLSFLHIEIIKITNGTSIGLKYDEIINFLRDLGILSHIFGVLSILLFSIIFYIGKKEKLKIIFKVLKRKDGMTKNIDSIFTEKEAKKYLVEFSKDAHQIYLLAGDADFINEDDPQFNDLLKYRDRCFILINKEFKSEKDSLFKLINNHVNIRIYLHHSNQTLRGRLKRTSYNKAACLFDKRGGEYHFMEIDNSIVTDALFDKYRYWFDQGINPLIKYVLFDLGNVYLNGDYHDFIKKVENLTSKKIQLKSDNYLCASEDLNLGRIDILEHISIQIDRPLNDNERKEIKRLWNNNWTINEEVQKIAFSLRNAGYIVCLASNCDRDNADIYELKNYLDAFQFRFFSFDVNHLKPLENYYKYVLNNLKAQPYELLLIDDHLKNIDVCADLGIHGLYVSRSISESERAEHINNKLSELHLKY